MYGSHETRSEAVNDIITTRAYLSHDDLHFWQPLASGGMPASSSSTNKHWKQWMALTMLEFIVKWDSVILFQM